MTKNVLLINLPTSKIEDSQYDMISPIYVPIGLLSMAAYVKANSKYDVNFKILNLQEVVFNTLKKTKDVHAVYLEMANQLKSFKEFSPDIIGMSANMSMQLLYLESILETVSTFDKKPTVLLGGCAASNYVQNIFDEHASVDSICYGEGEIPLLQLVDSDDHLVELDKNVSFITRNSLKLNQKPQYQFIEDLDLIPPLDYELLDVEVYFAQSKYLIPDKELVSEEDDNVKSLVFFTSRGCPHNCVFCASMTVHGHRHRTMSVDRVISDLARLKEKYKFNYLLIGDDHFIFNKERAIAILNRLADLKLLGVACLTVAVNGLDRDLAIAFKNANCRSFSLAIESFSDNVLKNIIKKPLKQEMIAPIVKMLKEEGFKLRANILIGFPGETEEDREISKKMVAEVGLDWVSFFVAAPIIGSRLYNICEEKGYFVNDAREVNFTTCQIKTDDFTPEEMSDKVYKYNLEVNFLKNYNYVNGNYEVAITYFNAVAIKHNHAFAHYMLYKCYSELNDNQEKIDYHRDKYNSLATEKFWSELIRYFDLPSKL